MTPKIIRPYSEEKRKDLTTEEYLEIERAFHDNYADTLDWDKPLSENLSYDRDAYGLETEEYFLQKLGNVTGKKLLDIGSGHGNTAFNLAKKGAIVYSIDIAPKLIEGCKYRSQKNNIPVDFKVMDASCLTFPDETFDIIVGFRTIHHLQDLSLFCKEAYRCLKKGGFLLIVEPQKHNPFVEFGRIFIKNKEDSRTPTEHPIIPKDIRMIREIFGNLEKKEFEFLQPAALTFRGIRGQKLFRFSLKVLKPVDNLLQKIPFLRPLYWQVIIKTLKK